MLAATLLVSPLCASTQESRANVNDAIRCTVGALGGEPIDGLGVELDPHFLSANAAAGIGVKESDWDNVVVPRLRDLAFSKWRVMVLPWWYEPENDNDNPMLARPSGFTFESPEMRGLYRQLDLAQQDSIPVCLVFWGVRPGTFMLPEEGQRMGLRPVGIRRVGREHLRLPASSVQPGLHLHTRGDPCE